MRENKSNGPLVNGEFSFISSAELALVRTETAILENFARLIPAIFGEQPGDEIFLRPAELREIARSVGAFAWTLKAADPTKLSATQARSERAAFSRTIDKMIGRGFSNGVRFDSIGYQHSKLYTFTKSRGRMPKKSHLHVVR